MAGGGVTGAAIRAFDWASTPLGNPATWPAGLRTAVSLMLGSAAPVYLAWGPSLTSLYNDAFLPFLGTKGSGIGRAYAELWSEIWVEYEPIVAATLAGKAQHFVDQPVPLAARPGVPISYCSYSYTPLRDDTGAIVGLYNAVTETTDRVLGNAALRASEARMRGVLDAMGEGFVLLDRDYRVVDINAEALRLEGRGRGELIGAVYWDVWPGVADTEQGQLCRRVMEQRAAQSIEARWQWPDGQVGWFEISAFPADDGVALFYRDVTARHAGQRALAASEERLRLAVDHAEIGFWDVDTVNDILIWPPRVKAMFGISAAVPVSMADFYNGLHPDDREATAAAYGAATDPVRRALYDVEYRTVGKEDGVIRRVAAKGRGLFDADERCTRVIGTAIDVTARRQTEAALRASDAWLRRALAAAELGAFGWVLATGAVTLDARSRAIFGFAGGSGTTATAIFDRIHPDDRDRIRAQAAAATATLTRIENEYRIVRPDGATRIVASFSDMIAGPDGSAERLVGVFADVTERRANERRLRELNETLEREIAARTGELRQFQAIVEATASPICAFDTDFRLIAFNKAHNDEFRRVNGFDTKVGDVFPDLFIAEQRPVMRSLMARALTGERFTIAAEFGRPELGVPMWEIVYAPLRNEQGDIVGAFHLATDISDRRRAEADLAAAQDALRQSQKMEAMGQLTGGVAHDFNNLLTPIVGSLDLLQRRALGGEREQRLIAGAMQSAERATLLVQRLLAFARRQPLQPRPVDVGALVAGIADLVASTSGPQTRLALDVARDLPAAVADPNQLEMAILNLSVNARDAMPDGGRLTIAAQAETVDAEHRSGLPAGRYVRLSVADTGAGMDAETLRRAVEPFFSTKGVGKGTGLGLSMVHGLAAQLGGVLLIDSRPGLGTSVELWLPTTGERAAEPARPTVPTMVPKAGTVIVVDDEPLVRASTAAMLADLDYAVSEAASAEEALRLIEGGTTPDLLVTDHLMPGMTGTELARTLQRRLPGLRVLLVSGFAEVDDVAPDLPRLEKPFRQVELAASLAALPVPSAAD